MIITTSYAVFACHSAACAPPPAGKGGSSGGGSNPKPNFSVGMGEHRFKNVSHARASVEKLAKTANRTDNQNERLQAGHKYLMQNDKKYRLSYINSRRNPKNTDDGYDALKDRAITSGIWGSRRSAGYHPITGRPM